jgi:hypothetical protein
MADLHKFTVQESLNASQGHAGGWTVAARQTVEISSGSTQHFPLNAATTILMLQPSVDTQFSFTTAEADIVPNNDLHIPADNLTSLVVPRNLGSTIIINFIGLSSAGTMKVVEV